MKAILYFSATVFMILIGLIIIVQLDVVQTILTDSGIDIQDFFTGTFIILFLISLTAAVLSYKG